MSLFKQEPEDVEEEDIGDSLPEEDLTSPLSIVLNAKRLETVSTLHAASPSTPHQSTSPTTLIQGSLITKSDLGQLATISNLPSELSSKPKKQSTDRKGPVRTEKRKKFYQCQQCRKKFATALEVMYHIHTHFQTRRIQNLVLNKRILSALTLKWNLLVYGEKLHEETGKTTAVHRCKLCSREFPLRILYTKHFNRCHVKCSKCPHCLKPFPQSSLPLHIAQKHIRTFTNSASERLKCRLCHQPFVHARTLRNHRHDSKQMITLLCTAEGCSFQTKGVLSRLVEHVEQEHPHMRYRCQHRGCSFSAPVPQLVQR